jgi:hypothetical protein
MGKNGSLGAVRWAALRHASGRAGDDRRMVAGRQSARFDGMTALTLYQVEAIRFSPFTFRVERAQRSKERAPPKLTPKSANTGKSG